MTVEAGKVLDCQNIPRLLSKSDAPCFSQRVSRNTRGPQPTVLPYRSRWDQRGALVVQIFRGPTCATHLLGAHWAAAPTSSRQDVRRSLPISRGLYCLQRFCRKTFGSRSLDVCLPRSPSPRRMPAALYRRHLPKNLARFVPCSMPPQGMQHRHPIQPAGLGHSIGGDGLPGRVRQPAGDREGRTDGMPTRA